MHLPKSKFLTYRSLIWNSPYFLCTVNSTIRAPPVMSLKLKYFMLQMRTAGYTITFLLFRSRSVFISATDVYTPTCGSIQPWSLMSQAAAISPFDGFSFSPWWDRVRGKELVLWAVGKSGNMGCTPQIFLKDSNLCSGLLYKSAKWFSY